MENNSDENGFETELLSEIEVWSLGLEIIETSLELPPDLQGDVLDPIEQANTENAQAVQPASDQQVGVSSSFSNNFGAGISSIKTDFSIESSSAEGDFKL